MRMMEDGAYLSTVGGLVTGSSLTAVFALMLLKEIGVPVPIPIDLVVIAAGVQAAQRSALPCGIGQRR